MNYFKLLGTVVIVSTLSLTFNQVENSTNVNSQEKQSIQLASNSSIELKESTNVDKTKIRRPGSRPPAGVQN